MPLCPSCAALPLGWCVLLGVVCAGGTLNFHKESAFHPDQLPQLIIPVLGGKLRCYRLDFN